MSIPDPTNPYASPTAPPVAFAASVSKPTFKPIERIEYWRTISYVFDNPNWFLNALWSFVSQLVAGIIPIVPQMVLMGYQFEVIDSLLMSDGKRYPDFNLNRIGDYLTRGIWPFLAMFVVAIACGMAFGLLALVCVGCIAGAAGLSGEDAGPIIATVGILVGIVLGILLMLLIMLLITPATIRGGITQDFAATFDFGWIRDFIRKMWIEVVLSTLFLIAVSFAAIVFTCGLGYFVVIPLVPFVQAHFWYQFYVLYLARGGAPIPTKPIAMPAQIVPPPGTY